MCKLGCELRGSEVSGSGLDPAASFSTEATGKLVEVQLWLGH
jgi:hypothetical protein